jgi:hypothetical protein
VPRISAEDRAAAVFRAGRAPLPPPKGLSADAKSLWRRIVADRPTDWFRPGSDEILESFCVASVEARRLAVELHAASSDDPEYFRLIRGYGAIVTTMIMAATKLRLTTLASVERHSGKNKEHGDYPHDPLLGGRIVSINSKKKPSGGGDEF